jgi:hypothetical protein
LEQKYTPYVNSVPTENYTVPKYRKKINKVHNLKSINIKKNNLLTAEQAAYNFGSINSI